MISNLTEAQEAKLAEYVKMGIAQGLSCEPIDEVAGEEYANKLMRWLGREYKGTVFVDSPLSACYAIHYLKSDDGSCDEQQVLQQVGRRVWQQVEDQIEDQVKEQVRQPVLHQVGHQIEEPVEEQVREKVGRRVWQQVEEQVLHPVEEQVGQRVRDQVEEQVWSQVRKQVLHQVLHPVGQLVLHPVWKPVEEQVGGPVRKRVWKRVWNQVWEQVGRQVRKQVGQQGIFIWPWLDGQWYAYFHAWYTYYRDVLHLDFSSIPLWIIEDQIEFGGIYPLTNFVVISRRPLHIHTDEQGELHCDGDAAVKYADGLCVYSLNGVIVPEWLAVRSENDIDPKDFATVDNAEVRREFVRKVGIERIYQECGGSVLDTSGDYELVEVDLGGEAGRCPYLKMLNPSIGVWHLEGVPKGTKSVQEALSWRNQSDLSPTQLT